MSSGVWPSWREQTSPGGAYLRVWTQKYFSSCSFGSLSTGKQARRKSWSGLEAPEAPVGGHRGEQSMGRVGGVIQDMALRGGVLVIHRAVLTSCLLLCICDRAVPVPAGQDALSSTAEKFTRKVEDRWSLFSVHIKRRRWWASRKCRWTRTTSRAPNYVLTIFKVADEVREKSECQEAKHEPASLVLRQLWVWVCWHAAAGNRIADPLHTAFKHCSVLPSWRFLFTPTNFSHRQSFNWDISGQNTQLPAPRRGCVGYIGKKRSAPWGGLDFFFN